MEYVTLNTTDEPNCVGHLIVRFERPIDSNGTTSVCFHGTVSGRYVYLCYKPVGIRHKGYERPRIYLLLSRIVDPYLLGGEAFPTKPTRFALLDDEQKLLDTLRRGW